MEILLEPTSNKLMVEHAEYDESNTYVLERFNTTAGNPVKEILLKLNLPDHRSILTDSKEYIKMDMETSATLIAYVFLEVTSIKVKEFQRSFRHSDTERLSRSDEVLKLKNFKKDAALKLFKSTNQESLLKHILYPAFQAELNALTDLVKLFVRESIRAAGVAGLGVIVGDWNESLTTFFACKELRWCRLVNDPESISVGNLWGEVMPFFFTNWVQSLPVRTSTFGVKKVNPAVEELFDTVATWLSDLLLPPVTILALSLFGYLFMEMFSVEEVEPKIT
ncbi:hypothetical protein Tco_0759043 [Tanacetum coccineum]